MDLKNTITQLSEASGASGSEEDAAGLALAMLREYCPMQLYRAAMSSETSAFTQRGVPSLFLTPISIRWDLP